MNGFCPLRRGVSGLSFVILLASWHLPHGVMWNKELQKMMFCFVLSCTGEAFFFVQKGNTRRSLLMFESSTDPRHALSLLPSLHLRQLTISLLAKVEGHIPSKHIKTPSLGKNCGKIENCGPESFTKRLIFDHPRPKVSKISRRRAAASDSLLPSRAKRLMLDHVLHAVLHRQNLGQNHGVPKQEL